MTEDTQNTKQTKLTLSSGKLSLNRTIDGSLIRKNIITSKNNSVTVELKTNKLGLASKSQALNLKAFGTEGDLTDSERSSRLNVLKKAAITAKVKKDLEETENLENAALAEEELQPIVDNKVVSEEVITPVEPEEVKPVYDNNTIKARDEHVKIKQGKAADIEAEEAEREKKLSESKIAAGKLKRDDGKKFNKTAIFSLLDSDAEGLGENRKTRSLASIKRAREKEKRKLSNLILPEKIYREVILPEVISVSELAARMSERVADVIKELMKLGVFASSMQNIDADTAELVASSLGHTIKRVQESDVENIIDDFKDSASDLLPRAPVVTVMGHVDHGKTSLLDALKSTNVVEGEAGGITQHIGAYTIETADKKFITFIDTPGHEAFTEMRTRGAKVTDIVVLVVAADDGIKAQTIEAINHAKAAGVPIIVAVNKIDRPGANIEKVKNELLNHNLVAEELGGDVMIIPVSALKRTNLDSLVSSILALAEMLDLRANPNAAAMGTVIESRIDKNRGTIVTTLVQRGTLNIGDIIVAGQSYGKVKRLYNDKGKDITTATPSIPVEIIGLNKAPRAGDNFAVVNTEKQARDITEYRERKEKETKVSAVIKLKMEDIFTKVATGAKELAVILKGDVHGSIEAIAASLEKLSTSEVYLRVLHSAVGGITESDIALAEASKAIILAFNVRTTNAASIVADRLGVDIRYYSIIYNLIDDIKLVMGGMLSPIIREQYLGTAEVRQVFNITKSGKIAGCHVLKGIIKRGSGVRLIREDVVIYQGKLKTLKRFKDDVKEVRENFECGIALENFEDIKISDKIESFETVEEKRTL